MPNDPNDPNDPDDHNNMYDLSTKRGRRAEASANRRARLAARAARKEAQAEEIRNGTHPNMNQNAKRPQCIGRTKLGRNAKPSPATKKATALFTAGTLESTRN